MAGKDVVLQGLVIRVIERLPIPAAPANQIIFALELAEKFAGAFALDLLVQVIVVLEGLVITP